MQIYVAEGNQRPIEVAAGAGRNGRVEEHHGVVKGRGDVELALGSGDKASGGSARWDRSVKAEKVVAWFMTSRTPQPITR